ncbi:hypothetical protein CC2G_006248 [Coprinopsis cinerea AmutBmut pab1-1]|nr:hypothetical protein CC2G_006248 [Coprinopsis cinerea AmutBmut pab1-1]
MSNTRLSYIPSVMHALTDTPATVFQGNQKLDLALGAPPSRAREPKEAPKAARGKNRSSRAYELFLWMPAEVLLEILGKVDPADLLQLARTSWGLRGILMSKRSSPIWKTSLASVEGLPPCPEDLDLPQWVELVFGKSCHFCHRNVRAKTVWELRFRGCTNCLKERFTVSTMEKGVALGYMAGAPSLTFDRRSRDGWYHGDTYEKWKAEYNAIPDHSELQKTAWVAGKASWMHRRNLHAVQCINWVEARESARRNVLEAVKRERMDDILSRLNGKGFSKEIDALRDRVEFWTDIRQFLKEDVTDRMWTDVGASVVACAKLHQSEILRQRRKSVFESRMKLLTELHRKCHLAQPINDFFLSYGDLFLTPEVSQVIDRADVYQELTLVDFDHVVANISLIAARWVSETKGKLLSVLQQQLPTEVRNRLPENSTLSESSLDLAIATFHCGRCLPATPIPGPKPMNHLHALAHTPLFTRNGQDGSGLPLDLVHFLVGVPMNEERRWMPWGAMCNFQVDRRLAVRTASFVENFGRDPATTTFQELNDLDEIFECTVCSTLSKGRLMLDWRLAILHECDPGWLIRVDPRTASIVRARMEEERIAERVKLLDLGYSYISGDRPSLVCVHCRYSADTGIDIREHLEQKHGITEPSDNDVKEFLGTRKLALRKPYRYWKFGSSSLL